MSAPDPDALLVLPRLKIQNANAISSPLTWGFPSASAFTGFVHALQRRLGVKFELEMDGVAVVCHRFEPQVSQPSGRRTHVFNLTRNPLDKDGSTAAIVEEGRIHLLISLVVGIRGATLHSGISLESLADAIWQQVMAMRIAGGSVLPPTLAAQGRHRAELLVWPDTYDERRRVTKKLARRLLPGFALVSREARLHEHLEELRKVDAAATGIDALLDLSRLNFEPPKADAVDADWSVRAKSGWLVPIPIGYAAISPLHAPGDVKNVRDRTVPFRFVESLFSLGEWLSPHRVNNICDLFWHHGADLEAGIYRCTTPAYASQLSS